jgi:hypothetical protein
MVYFSVIIDIDFLVVYFEIMQMVYKSSLTKLQPCSSFYLFLCTICFEPEVLCIVATERVSMHYLFLFGQIIGVLCQAVIFLPSEDRLYVYLFT